MKNLFYLIMLLGLSCLIGCDDDRSINSFTPFEPGNYKGTSALTINFDTDSAYTRQVEVLMNFTENRFTHSLKPNEPALYIEGDYQINGNKIDMAADNTIILAIFGPPEVFYGGEFTYYVSGQTVTMNQFKREFNIYWKIVLNKL